MLRIQRLSDGRLLFVSFAQSAIGSELGYVKRIINLGIADQTCDLAYIRIYHDISMYGYVVIL